MPDAHQAGHTSNMFLLSLSLLAHGVEHSQTHMPTYTYTNIQSLLLWLVLNYYLMSDSSLLMGKFVGTAFCLFSNTK